MAKCQFSETQFVMGYLGEYFSRLRKLRPHSTPKFMLPTTSLEPLTGSDLIIERLSGLDFFQFKRSEFMNKRRGAREMASGLPKSFRPYYRFQIYNGGGIPQFDRLRDISAIHPSFNTYYCAPKFHTSLEFHNIFWRQEIMNNSALINCHQFNLPQFNKPHFNIDDGDAHYIVFNSSSLGYLCSEKKEVVISSEPIYFEESTVSSDATPLINDLFSYIIDQEDSNDNLYGKFQETSALKLQYASLYLMEQHNIMTIPKY